MSKKIFSKVALLILDGWGINKNPEVSAIEAANTPFFDGLLKQYTNSTLTTFGEAVGLPEGQIGNSEVGHINIGAGRVVYQELAKINKEIREGRLQKNQVLLDALNYAKSNNRKVHLLGLVSDGGVHSHINHLKAICDLTNEMGLDKVFIHACMDGRDTDPKKGIEYIKDLEQHLSGSKIKIATIIGRYFAMDRDKRWERIKKAYDLFVNAVGIPVENPVEAIENSYNKGITDEFLEPMYMVDNQNKPLATIENDDVVICFNFRTDRCRQITIVLTQDDFPEYGMYKIPLYYCTMTVYDEKFKKVNVFYKNQDVADSLGELLSKNGKSQLRIAETEKYPHVTFFFNGGRETAFEGEERIIVPSPKVATYDLQPEMSAYEVSEKVLAKLEVNAPDFICLNFANADMVGHTGVFEAAVKAAETVDDCLSKLVPLLLQLDYGIIIIADHGNSDCMVNPDGSVNTAHTTNPVPCIFAAKGIDSVKLLNGKLADIAPSILSLMGIEKSALMDGDNIIFY
jgi:2,3-bisphosphoglycerate-independent phosphoglycerate mutase